MHRLNYAGNNTGSLMRYARFALCALLLACALLVSFREGAGAVTSFQKQAEADLVMKEIDLLQTNLNEAQDTRAQALEAYEAAVVRRDEAQVKLDAERQHVAELQKKLSQVATSMYKTGGRTSFVDVILGSATFEDFLTSWDAISSISSQCASLVAQSKVARDSYEAARAEYERESNEADAQLKIADESLARIDANLSALQEELEKITEEIAELQRQEELQAEAARQAAEAAEAIVLAMNQAQAAENERLEAEAAAKKVAEEAAALEAEAKKAEQASESSAAPASSGEASSGASSGASSQEEASSEPAQQESAASEEAQTQQPAGAWSSTAISASHAIAAAPGTLTNPCPSAFHSSGFGWRDFNGGSYHQGLDMAAPEGTEFYAALRGTVIMVSNDGSWNGGAGNWVVIAHGNGLVTKYMHASEILVEVGDQVLAGDVIGKVGNTGESYGAHLHFQVEMNGVAFDPTTLL